MAWWGWLLLVLVALVVAVAVALNPPDFSDDDRYGGRP